MGTAWLLAPDGASKGSRLATVKYDRDGLLTHGAMDKDQGALPCVRFLILSDTFKSDNSMNWDNSVNWET